MRDYKEMIEAVSRILFEEDPIGINFQENTDEYDPEAGTILPRVRTCAAVDDLQKVVYEEFCQWFGPDIPGDASRYRRIAERIWTLAKSGT